jgi:hypothetical protein
MDFDSSASHSFKRFYSIPQGRPLSPKLIFYSSLDKADTLYAKAATYIVNSAMPNGFLRITNLLTDKGAFHFNKPVLQDALPQEAVLASAIATFFIQDGSVKVENPVNADTLFAEASFDSVTSAFIPYGIRAGLGSVNPDLQQFNLDITSFIQEYQNRRKKNGFGSELYLYMGQKEKDDLGISFVLADSVSLNLIYSLDPP